MPRVGDDPVAEPRGAAGGRSSNIIISVRREHRAPSFAPNRKSCPTCLWVAPIVAIDGGQPPPSRRERVGLIAGRSADHLNVGRSADRRRRVGAALARNGGIGASKTNAGPRVLLLYPLARAPTRRRRSSAERPARAKQVRVRYRFGH